MPNFELHNAINISLIGTQHLAFGIKRDMIAIIHLNDRLLMAASRDSRFSTVETNDSKLKSVVWILTVATLLTSKRWLRSMAEVHIK